MCGYCAYSLFNHYATEETKKILLFADKWRGAPAVFSSGLTGLLPKGGMHSQKETDP
jgi:hypothetical protein